MRIFNVFFFFFFKLRVVNMMGTDNVGIIRVENETC